MATVAAKRIVTIDEFLTMPEPTNGHRLELVRGEVREVPKPTWEHGEIAGNVYAMLKQFLKTTPLGRVSVECGVVLERGPDTVRGPDVSYMSKERLPLGERVNRLPEQPPDLCVEVISPSNTKRQIRDKVKEYFFAGVRMVWLVEPDDRSVTVLTAPDEGRTLYDTSTLTGGDVLPGFTCQVADLFA